jgi:hypothetical protein
MLVASFVLCGVVGSVTLAQQTSPIPLGSGIGYVVPKEVRNDPLYKITRAMFTENLKTKFTFQLEDEKLAEMTLIAVNNLNPPFFKSDGTGTRETFSLVFQEPSGLPLRQNTYTVEHDKLGTFRLFIVPGENTAEGKQYSAVINRLYP